MLNSTALVAIAVPAIPILIIKGLSWLKHHRRVRFKDFPQMKTSLVWGHLVSLAEQMAKGPEAEQFGKATFSQLHLSRGPWSMKLALSALCTG